MNEEELLSLLRRALVKAEPRFAAIAGTLTLETYLADLGVDSLMLLNMLGVVEEQLDIEVPDDKMVAAQTVAEVAALIREQMGRDLTP
jgi:acyl carrier protein